jgi:hypothetical protein
MRGSGVFLALVRDVAGWPKGTRISGRKARPEATRNIGGRLSRGISGGETDEGRVKEAQRFINHQMEWWLGRRQNCRKDHR